MELNAEWVARRLYKESFFNGSVSEETKNEAHDRLTIGLQAVARRAVFGPFVCGHEFTAADCVAYVHFTMIKLATSKIYGDDLLDRYVLGAAAYMRMMDKRSALTSKR